MCKALSVGRFLASDPQLHAKSARLRRPYRRAFGALLASARLMLSSPFDLRSRHALVTGCGSSGGIGFSVARLLGRLGASVSITSTTERIHERAGELGEGTFAHVADLSDRRQAFELAGAAREAHGPIHILVNAAGMVQTGMSASRRRPSSSSLQSALDRQLDITLKTAFHMTQAVLPGMLERRHGRVVMGALVGHRAVGDGAGVRGVRDGEGSHGRADADDRDRERSPRRHRELGRPGLDRDGLVRAR